MPAQRPSEIPLGPRKIVFSALDISTHPHPKGSYVKLFQAARKLRRAIKIVGYEYAELSRLNYIKDGKKVKWITGHVYRFVHIDQTADWFDRKTGEEVEKAEKDQIKIPDGWSPNTRKIFFAFNVQHHLLVFTRKNATFTLSPDQAAEFFHTLLTAACEKVPGVDFVETTTVKSRDALNRIFQKHLVSKLEIEVRRPNPDGPKDAFAILEAEMKAEQVQSKTETLKAEKGKSIKESPRIKQELEASLRHGRALATTYDDEGVREIIDTKQHPVEESHEFIPEKKMTFLSFIAEVAAEMVLAIVKKQK